MSCRWLPGVLLSPMRFPHPAPRKDCGRRRRPRGPRLLSGDRSVCASMEGRHLPARSPSLGLPPGSGHSRRGWHNCTFWPGSMRPSVPSALCRWRAGGWRPRQGHPLLSTNLRGAGSGSWPAPFVSRGIRLVVAGWLSPHSCPAHTCQPRRCHLLSCLLHRARQAVSFVFIRAHRSPSTLPGHIRVRGWLWKDLGIIIFPPSPSFPSTPQTAGPVPSSSHVTSLGTGMGEATLSPIKALWLMPASLRTHTGSDTGLSALRRERCV